MQIDYITVCVIYIRLLYFVVQLITRIQYEDSIVGFKYKSVQSWFVLEMVIKCIGFSVYFPRAVEL